MELKEKITCPTCTKEYDIVIGHKGAIKPRKCPRCGTPVSEEKSLKKAVSVINLRIQSLSK